MSLILLNVGKTFSKQLFIVGAAIGLVITSGCLSLVASAAENQGDFSLIITPSPLVATVKPGEPKDLELKIKNSGTFRENLKIESRKFTIDEKTGKITIDDTAPPDIAQWISISKPTVTVEPGQWVTEKIRIDLPKESGFSYSFALVISRAGAEPNVQTGAAILGSVADFTLINVDRPGAVRKLSVTDFSVDKGLYEYLPVTVSMKFKNTGNTIVQPYGNVFIQRTSTDTSPIATLNVNDAGGYILPGSARILNTSWSDGFPVYASTPRADGSLRRNLVLDWSKLGSFRMGSYKAKLVAAYNDGYRDVPLEREATFWVLPWKVLLGVLTVLLVLGIGAWTLLRRVWVLLNKDLKDSDTKSSS